MAADIRRRLRTNAVDLWCMALMACALPFLALRWYGPADWLGDRIRKSLRRDIDSWGAQ